MIAVKYFRTNLNGVEAQLVHAAGRFRFVFAALFAFLFANLFCGCSTLALNPKGAKILPGYEISIVQGSEQNGYYTSRDLLVYYQYHRTSDAMQIGGNIRFASHIQLNFTIVRYFNLQLLLADADGVILATKNIAGASFRGTDVELRFSDSFSLPPGASLMAFAYTGRATEGGGSFGRRRFGDDGVETDFWEYPVRRQ